MDTGILIIRDRDCYRVLHGHLHLANAMRMSDKAIVDVVDEGKLTVTRTRNGYLVGDNQQRLYALKTDPAPALVKNGRRPNVND